MMWQTQSTVRNYFTKMLDANGDVMTNADGSEQWYKQAVVETTFDYSTSPIKMIVLGIKLDQDGNKIESALTHYHLTDNGDTATIVDNS